MDDEIERIFSINFERYKYFGFWKIETESPAKRFWYSIYRFLAMAWITFFTALQLLDLYDASRNLHDFATNLCGTSTSIFTVTKSYMMLFNLERIERMRKKFRNNLNIPEGEFDEEDKKILRKSARGILQVTKAFFGLVVPTILCWTLIPLIDKSGKRKLPLRFWFPIDITTSPNYEFIYLYQVAGLWIFAVNVLTIDLITFGLIVQVCAQYEILERRIRSIDILYLVDNLNRVSVSREEKTTNLLKRSVVYHQKILSIASEIESIFRSGILVHMICGVVLICVIGFDIILASNHVSTQLLTQLGYVGSALFDVFFYCLFGQLLIDKSVKISEAAYSILWYKMEERPKKILNILMLRAQKPTKITAGKVFPINLSTYLSLLRISYNLMAVLQSSQQ